MIYSVHGKIIAKEIALIAVECGGVGYACKVTDHTYAQAGSVGEEIFLYTYLSVREDSAELFGFMDRQELECFTKLISVTGVGAKAALAILSELTPEQLILSISAEDTTAISRPKGIGKKIAQRIIVELKDKFTGQPLNGLPAGTVPAAKPKNSAMSDALEALEALGYTRAEVAPILMKLDENADAPTLIRLTLQEIGRQR